MGDNDPKGDFKDPEDQPQQQPADVEKFREKQEKEAAKAEKEASKSK